MSIVYKITNLINNKSYIGQTKMTLTSRWSKHLSSKSCTLLSRALNKYGKDNFSIEVIEQCSADILNSRESYWIDFYDTRNLKKGYNIRGLSSNIYSHSEETKDKLRCIAKLKGQKPPINPLKNPTSDTRAKLSELKGGRPFFAYTQDLTFVKLFVSSGEASKELLLESTHIRRVLRGKGKSVKGFLFSYSNPV